MTNWHRVRTELQQYQRYPQQGDIYLYHIGTEAGLLTEADVSKPDAGRTTASGAAERG